MDAAAWANGLIVTRDICLADFLAEVTHYHSGYLGCVVRAVDLCLSGAHCLNNIDKLLQTFAQTLPMYLQRHTHW